MTPADKRQLETLLFGLVCGCSVTCVTIGAFAPDPAGFVLVLVGALLGVGLLGYVRFKERKFNGRS